MVSALRANGLALAIAGMCLAGYLPFAPVRLHDLRAFYCAGLAVRLHADPYREHPLAECERRTTAPGVSFDADDVTVPAPLPGYALAGFALLSLVPFAWCVGIWIAASLAALAATIAYGQAVVRVPLEMAGVAIAVPAVVVALPLGQTSPFVGLAIVACARALAAGRPASAAIAALGTALDPPVAIALCATLVVAVPATRAVIASGTLLLVALSFATLGGATNLEYVQSVLHAHAVAGVAERAQFSTTHFAWVAGLGGAAALTIGQAWYALAVVAGSVTAIRLRRRFGIAAVALVPPAFAVFGGLYVHFSQLMLAIPAFLLIAQPAWKRACPIALFYLAVPWSALVAFPPFALGLIALGLVYARSAKEGAAGRRLGVGAAALLVALFCCALVMIGPAGPAYEAVVGQNPLVDVGWERYVAWRDPHPNALYLVLQAPTIAAFAVCLWSLAGAAFGPRATFDRRPGTAIVAPGIPGV